MTLLFWAQQLPDVQLEGLPQVFRPKPLNILDSLASASLGHLAAAVLDLTASLLVDKVRPWAWRLDQGLW